MTAPAFLQPLMISPRPSLGSCSSRRPRRVHVLPPRAVLDDAVQKRVIKKEIPPNDTFEQNPSTSTASHLDNEPSAESLRAEQLGAYFSSAETTYQAELRGALLLSLRNFSVEIGELVTALRRVLQLEPPLRYTPPDCLSFILSSEAVTNRERERMEQEGEVPASGFVRAVYDITCSMLDVVFEGRPVPRFWFLETVARMPYFAYSSSLHLLSTLGWFRSPTLMNMHHAEELNEAYHLAVMESLGGDKRWGDRFLAFHASIVYYWFLVILFLLSPGESYRFSQLIEAHAVDTYAEFVETNRKLLKSLPAPDVAYEYYDNFLYYFHEFQLNKQAEGVRRPQINSLLDVFENILLDEQEHTRTMAACTEFVQRGEPIWFNGKCVSASARQPATLNSKDREQFWKRWAKVRGEDR